MHSLMLPKAMLGCWSYCGIHSREQLWLWRNYRNYVWRVISVVFFLGKNHYLLKSMNPEKCGFQETAEGRIEG